MDKLAALFEALIAIAVGMFVGLLFASLLIILIWSFISL
jgi:hypothetical protein